LSFFKRQRKNGRVARREIKCEFYLSLQDEIGIMEYANKIITDPAIMLGKPVIKGTRITVELILRKLYYGMTIDQMLASYEHLSKEGIYAALTHASDLIANEEVIIPPQTS